MIQIMRMIGLGFFQFFSRLGNWIILGVIYFLIYQSCTGLNNIGIIYGRSFCQVPETIFLFEGRKLLFIFISGFVLLFSKMPELTPGASQQLIRTSRKKWFLATIGKLLFISLTYIVIYYFIIYVINDKRIYFDYFISWNMFRVLILLLVFCGFLSILCVLMNVTKWGKAVIIFLLVYIYVEHNMFELLSLPMGLMTHISFSLVLGRAVYSDKFFYGLLGILLGLTVLGYFIFYKLVKHMDFNPMEIE